MALAKERLTKDLRTSRSIQTRSLYENVVAIEDVEGLASVINYPLMNSIIPPSANFPDPSKNLNNGSENFMFGTMNSKPKEAHQPILKLKARSGYLDYSSTSMLSFEQGEQISQTNNMKFDHGEDYALWADVIESNHQLIHMNPKHGIESRLAQDANCFETASGCGSNGGGAKGNNQQREEQFGWIYSDAMADETLEEFGGLEESFHKRLNSSSGDLQASKKHCAATQRKPKNKTVESKDPQSIAAKNRRERISERLKILQELVPNGTKVDLVTMLEKAITYVKFLQLQVKVLAADEFWPSQGGKAPEIAQVKEAIDAILSSQRN